MAKSKKRSAQKSASFITGGTKSTPLFQYLVIFLAALVVLAVVVYVSKNSQRSEASTTTLYPPVGYIDGVDSGSCRVWGWACDKDNYNKQLLINILYGSKLLGQTKAEWYSPDMAGVCGGTFRHRFDYTFPYNSYVRGRTVDITARAYNIDRNGAILGDNTVKLTNSGKFEIRCSKYVPVTRPPTPGA